MKSKIATFLLAGAAALTLSTAGYAAGEKATQAQGQQTQTQPMQGQAGSRAGSAAQSAQQADQATQSLALQGEKLVGKTVYGANNQEVGEIDNVVMDQDKKVSAVLVDVGGFLGIGSKTVALPIAQLQPQGERIVALNLTKDQAKAMPEYEEKDTNMQNRAGQPATPRTGAGTTQPGQSRTQ